MPVADLSATHLLGPDDPLPVMSCPGSGSPWLLVADHAGNAVPRKLGALGLPDVDLNDHIGIDIGIWPVTTAVAAALGAEAIGQRYSRLVIDCNRKAGTSASIPEISDRRTVPGNAGRPFAAERASEILLPYQTAIAAALERAPAALLCAMHSFTRELAGVRREVDIGVIHGPRAELADAVMAGLETSGLRIGRNVPYRIDFAGDYTLPVHGEAGGRHYVEIEICQDLIGTAEGQARLAGIMATALRAAQASFS